MDKDQIVELGRLCSSNSILVVSKRGLFRLFCPFKAVVVQQVEEYSIGNSVTVLSVKMSQDLKLVYIIQNKGFYHHYFMIVNAQSRTETAFLEK